MASKTIQQIRKGNSVKTKLLSIIFLTAALASGIALAQGRPILSNVRTAQANDPVVRSESPHASHGAVSLAVGDLDLDTISYSNSNRQSQFVQGGTLDATLMPGKSIRFEGSRVEVTTSGSETWLGRSEDGWLALTRRNRRIAGIAFVDGDTFNITGSDRGKAVVKQLAKDSAADCGAAILDLETGDVSMTAGKASSENADGPNAKAVAAGQVVSIVITYSPEVMAYYGNALIANVDNLVASANQAYADSSINGLIHVSAYRLIAGSNGTSGTNQIQNISLGLTTSAWPFQQVPALRNDTRTDLVVHLVTRSTPALLCGAAQTLFRTSAFGDRYRGVIATNCPASDRTFTHEIGHMLGANHDLQYYAATHPTATAWAPGAYGFTDTAPYFNVRTIMGQAPYPGNDCTVASGCPRLNRFSSASQTYLYKGAGYPLGNYNADIASVFNGYTDPITQQTYASSMQHVASYRTGSVVVPSPVAGLTSPTCGSPVSVSWAANSGAIGWYQWGRTSFPVMAASKVLYEVNKTPQSDFVTTLPLGEASYLHVLACNDSGCSQRQSFGPINAPGACP